MKAIVLAAGIGQRLGDLTIEKPKCLTHVNGRSILSHTLENLEACGFNRVIIVIGYLGRKIVEEVGREHGHMSIEYVENELYARTNSMYSLWLVREQLLEGAVIIEGDCICEREIIKKVVQLPAGNSYWVVDRFTEEMDGCMLTADESGRIEKIQIIRERLPEYRDNNFKSTGILKIANDFGNALVRWLDEDVSKGNINIYYDLVVAKHITENPLYVCNIHGMQWCEVDDVSDLKKAEKIFKENESPLKLGIISDTHDNLINIHKGIEIMQENKVDFVLHAGDFISAFALKPFSVFSGRFLAVFGNNDGDKEILSDKAKELDMEIQCGPSEIQKGGKRILLMHEPKLLNALAKSGCYDIIIHGHTHYPKNDKVNNTLILNPGECCGWFTGKSGFYIVDFVDMEIDYCELH